MAIRKYTPNTAGVDKAKIHVEKNRKMAVLWNYGNSGIGFYQAECREYGLAVQKRWIVLNETDWVTVLYSNNVQCLDGRVCAVCKRRILLNVGTWLNSSWAFQFFMDGAHGDEPAKIPWSCRVLIVGFANLIN